MTNCFLIRDPREVIASYVKKREHAALEDLGFVQQMEIFDFICARTNTVPAVVDARDVLENPERTLRLLCDAVGVEFRESMLSWVPGVRETDGIWAKYWYTEVARSTSFRPYRKRDHDVPERFGAIHERCRECYDRLYQHRLQ